MIITKEAELRFKQLIIDDKLPRVEIIAGGCKGFEKKVALDTVETDDIQIQLSNGATIIMDPITHKMLANSIIDFKTSISSSMFHIDIPEAISTCGCGTSFTF
jgi:iron-sulfur cluster insertion protein